MVEVTQSGLLLKPENRRAAAPAQRRVVVLSSRSPLAGRTAFSILSLIDPTHAVPASLQNRAPLCEHNLKAAKLTNDEPKSGAGSRAPMWDGEMMWLCFGCLVCFIFLERALCLGDKWSEHDRKL